MNFDFYQQYKGYSNIDLLKIVKQPDDYQAAAVAVATQVLSEREVTAEEIRFMDDYLLEMEGLAKAKKEKHDSIKIKAADFLEPLFYPSEKIKPGKYVNILLFAIALQYAWSLFETLRRLINFLRCNHCSSDIMLIAELLTLLYVPLIFILLFKKRRWGWILLFADNLFSIISMVGQSYIFFKYQNAHHSTTTSFLLPIMIKGAFVSFLWGDSIANYFEIDKKTKKRTAIITTGITILSNIIMFLIF